MIKVTIHPHFRAEKEYAIGVLLSDLLGLPYVVVIDQYHDGYTLELPNGRKLIFEDLFFCRKKEGAPYTRDDIPVIVHHRIKWWNTLELISLWGEMGYTMDGNVMRHDFDIVASAFFMLSRWEEFVMPDVVAKDQYGRFSGAFSLAATHDFLHKPVVHEWASMIFECLTILGWPKEQRKKRQFTTVLSCDVDYPRLWWSKLEMARTLGGAFLRDNPREELRYWWENGVKAPKDPYDTFDEMMDWGERKGTAVQFNFLSQRPRHFDAWYSLKNPEIKKLIQQIADRGHIIGFHPSREAAADPQQFGKEIDALRQVSPVPVVSGRHHYLCFKAPATWQLWEKHQLKMDSTLGYHDLPGFRCGICVDYPVFDFLNRKTLTLREQPLLAMDVTFARYLGCTPEETIQRLENIRRYVQRHDGQFTLLWHNSSLNTWFWHPYRPVIEQMLL